MERYTPLHKPRLIEYIHIKHVTPVHNWIGIEMNINIINFTCHVYRYIVHLYIVMLKMLTSYCVRISVLRMSFDFNKPREHNHTNVTRKSVSVLELLIAWIACKKPHSIDIIDLQIANNVNLQWFH